MGGYGYSYQSYSSYSSGGLGRIDETPGPLLRKPFVPFVFGRNSDTHLSRNTNRSSEPEGHVTTKKLVPVASPPYHHEDEYQHSSPPPNQAYPARNDEAWRRQPSSPHGRPQTVDDFFNKIQIEASKPSKFVPVYGGANVYGDSGNFSNKPTGKYSNTEGHKPTGNTGRNDNSDRPQPAGKYSAVEPNKATTGGGWTRSGNGGHLTEATNDIGKAMDSLKEAGNAKSTRSEPEPTNKIGQIIEPAESVKNIGIAPSTSRVAVPIEGTTPNKDNHRENTDSSRSWEATGQNGNTNFTTRPRISQPPNAGRFGRLKLGPTINSAEAEKFYNGTRI